MTRFSHINKEVGYWHAINKQLTPVEMADTMRVYFWNYGPHIFVNTGKVEILGSIFLEISKLSNMVSAAPTLREARAIISNFRTRRNI